MSNGKTELLQIVGEWLNWEKKKVLEPAAEKKPWDCRMDQD